MNKLIFLKLVVLGLVASEPFGIDDNGELDLTELRSTMICITLNKRVHVINVPKGYNARVYSKPRCRGEVVYYAYEGKNRGVPDAESVQVFKVQNQSINVIVSESSNFAEDSSQKNRGLPNYLVDSFP